MRYAAIADQADHPDNTFPITFMCDQLGVSRQGYYQWRRRTGPGPRETADAGLTTAIREIHDELTGAPGVRRIWAELQARGHRVSRKRVWRLMRAAGLQGRHPRAWRVTTIAGRRPIDAPDLLGQDFTASETDTAWLSAAAEDDDVGPCGRR